MQTLQYIYTLTGEDKPDERWLEWHWHPSLRPEPHCHVHLPHPSLGDLPDLHLPTSRVSFEEIVRFLIEDLGVRASADWQATLKTSQDRYQKYRRWPRTGPDSPVRADLDPHLHRRPNPTGTHVT